MAPSLLLVSGMPGVHQSSDEAEARPSQDPRDPDDAPDRARGDEPGAEDDDREHRVAHRPNPLPSREEDEEELAEADILDELDVDDLHRMDGPDA